MVSDAAATKAPIAKVADRVSGVFVPVVIAIALIATAVWLAAGADFGLCSGAGYFRAGHQLPVRAGTGHAGSHHGGQRQWEPRTAFMFKTAVSLEETGKVRDCGAG